MTASIDNDATNNTKHRNFRQSTTFKA